MGIHGDLVVRFAPNSPLWLITQKPKHNQPESQEEEDSEDRSVDDHHPIERQAVDATFARTRPEGSSARWHQSAWRFLA
jgi:hypothetical protein